MITLTLDTTLTVAALAAQVREQRDRFDRRAQRASDRAQVGPIEYRAEQARIAFDHARTAAQLDTLLLKLSTVA